MAPGGPTAPLTPVDYTTIHEKWVGILDDGY